MPLTCSTCATANPDGARFCAKCGTDLFAGPATSSAAAKRGAAALPTAPAPRSMLWLASGALAVVLAAVAWWLLMPSPGHADRGNASALGTTASVAAATPVAAPPLPGDTGAASAAASTQPLTPAELWDPIPADELQAARDQAAKLRVAREAKALAAREGAALAEQDAARQRADDARAAMPPLTPPPTGPVPRSVTSAPVVAAPAVARTVQEACADRNPIAQAICESRECSRAEHANDATCKRVRAAEERRRQPE